MNILVTGGASGVGSAITRRLAQGGKHLLFFTYRRSQDAARAIEKEFPTTKGIPCDFAQAASVSALLEQLARIDLDVLVNNALTGMTVQHFHKMNPQMFQDQFQSNILPLIKITQEAIRIFRKKKFGKIITILTSYLLNSPPMGLSEYVASKAYIGSLSKSWAAENMAFNITSNCISPSFMKTNLTRDTDERVIQEIEARSPRKQLLTPDEVASAVQDFVDDTQQKINGTNRVMDGVV